ncbi:SprB repeat-containing protein [Flavobacterium sp. ANB]|uniref:SprB repeat-containing protein n=1 Tax=unclassified Flavobacterium TaxID=196869 RepID=UPI00188C8063|nr:MULTISPECIES: SprB repeat-containing protein [unclassified Flavobacterium]MBF4516611.1 SprB repeat-containing protein [Flavobacterium sp. ANB]
MKTNYGGCNDYVNGNHIYEDDYEYKIIDDHGNWLCPIVEAGEYLIFNQMPSAYLFASYKAETFSCSGGCGDYHSVGLMITTINTCQKYVGYSYGYNGPSPPNFEIISNKVIADPPADNSFCDKISLSATGCTGSQRFYWEYSKDGSHFIPTNISTAFNQNYEFIKANFALLDNYTGPIYFHAIIDSDPSITQENIYSNVVNYNIISCSPLLNGNPVVADVRCNNESNGSVTLNFKTDITTNQKLLLNLFKDNNFMTHKFVSYAEIVNKSFTWTGIAAGSYVIKYQAQTNTDNNILVGSQPVISPTFTIANVTPLTFTVTPIQPACVDDKGKIQISASGGTTPYFYVLDNEPLTNKHSFTGLYTIPNELSEGDHKVIVLDSRDCIEK